MGNEGDLGGKRGKCRNERVGLVAANPDSLESNKMAGGEHKVLEAQSSKKCTSKKSAYPQSRLIRGFRNKYNCSLLGKVNTSGIE